MMQMAQNIDFYDLQFKFSRDFHGKLIGPFSREVKGPQFDVFFYTLPVQLEFRRA